MARHPKSALDNPDYQPGLGLSVEIRRPRKQLRAHRLAGLGPVSRISPGHQSRPIRSTKRSNAASFASSTLADPPAAPRPVRLAVRYRVCPAIGLSIHDGIEAPAVDELVALPRRTPTRPPSTSPVGRRGIGLSSRAPALLCSPPPCSRRTRFLHQVHEDSRSAPDNGRTGWAGFHTSRTSR